MTKCIKENEKNTFLGYFSKLNINTFSYVIENVFSFFSKLSDNCFFVSSLKYVRVSRNFFILLIVFMIYKYTKNIYNKLLLKISPKTTLKT